MNLRKLYVTAAIAALSLLPATSVAASDIVVVSPSNMHGWVFFEDNNNGPGSGHMVSGPGHPPLGEGSAELTVAPPTVAVPVDRQALGIQAYQGTMLRDITDLTYWTYQTDPTHAVTLQFDIRFHPADTKYQGRLVFEPGAGSGNPGILPATWQPWNALNGKWWASHPGDAGGMCIQATPCTWAQVKTNWPGASLWPFGNLLFKVGGPWLPWTGNVDAFTIGIQGRETTTYDFEPRACQEADGNGDFKGQQQGNFSFDEDGCADGDQDNVQSANRGDGKAFQSTRIDSLKFDSALHSITVAGAGLSAGLPVTFVLTAIEAGPAAPGWVSLTFSDGYSNAGSLLNGSITLH
jgi:hypothetical protein